MALGGRPGQRARGTQLPSSLPACGGLLSNCPGSGLPMGFLKPRPRRGKERGCGEPQQWGGGQEKECPREIRPLWSPGKPGEDSRAGEPVRSKSDSWTGPHPPFQSPEGQGPGARPCSWPGLVPVLRMWADIAPSLGAPCNPGTTGALHTLVGNK